jgi:hypothetical protein
MKTLFLRSSFMLFASAISFANIDTKFDNLSEILAQVHPSSESIDVTVESKNQAICLNDRISDKNVCLSKEELIMCLVIAGVLTEKPLSPRAIDFIRKSTIPDFKGFFVAKQGEMINFSIETADKNHSFSSHIKKENDQASYVLNAHAQGTISKESL